MTIPVPETITAISALITSFGALIASIISNNSSKQVGRNLKNSSEVEAATRVEMASFRRELNSLGHQMGETRADVTATREDVNSIRRDVSSLLAKELLK